MARFRHHKYTWEKPFGNARHSWQVVGPDGGVHFHVSPLDGYPDCAGLEFHHAASAGFRCDEAPDHITCPVIGQPCWHDGTSMYATDHLWPMIKQWLRSGEHEAIFACLEAEYESHFGDLTAARRLNQAA